MIASPSQGRASSHDESRSGRRLGRASEVLVLALVCGAPWAFGAVEAWAVLVLDLGIALLAVLGLIAGWSTDRPPRRSVPGLALGGLALLALAQTAPLPEGILRRVAPAWSALRASLVPGVPEQVIGDPGPAVALPPPTLSEDPEATTRMAAQLAALWVLFGCVRGLGGDRASFRRFGAALVINATLLALFSLVQSLTWNGRIYWLRPSPSGHAGPFVCHNHLAAYLNLGLGFALGSLLSRERRSKRARARGASLWAAYAAGVIAVGVLASMSRTGCLALATATVVTLLVARPRGSHFVAGMVALGVLVPLLLLALGTSSAYQQRLATLLVTAPYAQRMQVWGVAAQAWWTSPVAGTGLGTFAVSTLRLLPRETGEFLGHAENEYLEYLAEGGVLGLALVLLGAIGTFRLGWRVLEASPRAADRAAALGALFGGVSLAIQSLGDFALHIPGVAVAAVVLAAHVCRPELAAAGPLPSTPYRRGLRAAVPGLGRAVVALLLLAHGWSQARAEAALAGSGLPLPGTQLAGVGLGDVDWPALERMQGALERALGERPDWAEGHLRLGITLLGAYQRSAAESLGGEVPDPRIRAVLADPLWLRGVVLSSSPEQLASSGGLLGHEPIRLYLVPAARSFLEARRCCPVLALPHAELAALDFLLRGADPAGRYLDRAVGLAGADTRVVTLALREAIELEDRRLAGRCWRRLLLLSGGSRWEQVADRAGAFLSADEILDLVATDGLTAFRFADRLYSGSEDRAARERLLRASLARLPRDAGLSPADRLQVEARVWARLDDRARARGRMEAALALEPQRAEWRKDLVDWLIGWGQLDAAHDQALVALALSPGHPDARHAVEMAAEALARGPVDPPSPFPGPEIRKPVAGP